MKQLAFPLLLLFFAACNTQSERSATTDSISTDSLQVVGLLREVYQWHDKIHENMDFDVVIEDSVQTKLDLVLLDKRIGALSRTGFFSASFITNYRQLGELINTKLVNAHPKYQNEINFPFQEADSWTWFQDELPEYWTKFIIEDLKIGPRNASLKWRVKSGQFTTVGYGIAFVKENGTWKITYLAGFDQKLYQE